MFFPSCVAEMLSREDGPLVTRFSVGLYRGYNQDLIFEMVILAFLVNSAAEVDEDFAYSASFLHNILESIKTDDVRGPLVAVLNELNVQQGGVRRSAYREILYLVLVALGKSMIDVGEYLCYTS